MAFEITTPLIIASLCGLAIGLILGAALYAATKRKPWQALREEHIRLQAEVSQTETLEEERLKNLALARGQLAETFDELAQRSLQSNSEQFLRLAQENMARQKQVADQDVVRHQQTLEQLVKPINATLDATQKQIKSIENERYQAYGKITEQLGSLSELQRSLTIETHQLASALKNPTVRGQWGEMHLKRLIELAGLVEHCDFETQKSVQSNSGQRQRPDVLIHLPEGGHVVIDAKSVLSDYMAALEADSESERERLSQLHAKRLKTHVKELSSKAYWEQFQTSPDYVILYLPGDQFLSAALNSEPTLLDDALKSKVVLTTPGSLFALLKALAHGWRQVNTNKNAERISELAEQFQQDFTELLKAIAELGTGLNKSVRAYNKAFTRLEDHVLPGTEELSKVGAAPPKALPKLKAITGKVKGKAQTA